MLPWGSIYGQFRWNIGKGPAKSNALAANWMRDLWPCRTSHGGGVHLGRFVLTHVQRALVCPVVGSGLSFSAWSPVFLGGTENSSECNPSHAVSVRWHTASLKPHPSTAVLATTPSVRERIQPPVGLDLPPAFGHAVGLEDQEQHNRQSEHSQL